MAKKNELIEIKIEELLFPNKGIGKYEGQKAVVKNTLPEQKVMARVKRKKNGVIEAELIEVVDKSPYEIPSGCGSFDVCGGCAYQNISRQYELSLKEKQVKNLLDNAGVQYQSFEPIISSPVEQGYRNKCEFSFGDEEKGGALALGMRKRNSFYEVASLKNCNIVDEDFLEIVDCTVDFFRKYHVSFYHKKKHEGCLRHLIVRKGAYTGEILINLVTTEDCPFSQVLLKDTLLKLKLDGKICGILHTVNNSVADAVICEKMEILYGRDYLTDRLFDLEFKISAFSFFQTNTRGAETLYSIVREFAGNTGDKTIFDLYCGTGTIGQIMAEGAKKVIGIELVEEAVQAANENAIQNGIQNCQFIAGDVLKKVEELEDKPDLIIVDPPREGIHPKAIGKIISFGAPKIVYVSCKPTSLARDLQVFQDNGYQIDRVKCVDQFCRTRHVETVVLLEKES